MNMRLLNEESIGFQSGNTHILTVKKLNNHEKSHVNYL